MKPGHFLMWAFAVTALAPHRASAQDLWGLLSVAVDVGPQLGVTVTAFALSDMHLRGGIAEANARLTPWMTISPGVLLGGGSHGGTGVFERREQLDLTLHGRIGRLQLTARHLIELRHTRLSSESGLTQTASTILRARFRAAVTLPLASPFVMIEPFYDLGSGRHARTWIMTGFSFPAGTLRFEPYYLWRIDHDGAREKALALATTWRP